MAKNTLPVRVKNYITVHLAFRLTPSEIAKRVERLFGLKITRQGINAYNPQKRAGKNLSRDLKYLFLTIRGLYDDETARKIERKSKAAGGEQV